MKSSLIEPHKVCFLDLIRPMKVLSLVTIILGLFLNEARAQVMRFPQDGPNCFNTSLTFLGYTENQIFTSPNEISYYVKNFCRPEKEKLPTKARQVLVYFSDGEPLHSILSLDGIHTVEKYSLLGTHSQPHDFEPNPGEILKHKLSDSVYMKNDLEETTSKTYSCEPAGVVNLKMTEIKKHPAIQEQLIFRSELAKAVLIESRKDLEENIMNHLMPIMLKLSWNQKLQKQPLKGQDLKYFVSLLRSNLYQMHLLNCSESVKKYDECYAPEVQKSIDLTDSLFEKLYAIEKSVYHN